MKAKKLIWKEKKENGYKCLTAKVEGYTGVLYKIDDFDDEAVLHLIVDDSSPYSFIGYEDVETAKKAATKNFKKHINKLKKEISLFTI